MYNSLKQTTLNWIVVSNQNCRTHAAPFFWQIATLAVLNGAGSG
jgi:hypothetical protein